MFVCVFLCIMLQKQHASGLFMCARVLAGLLWKFIRTLDRVSLTLQAWTFTSMPVCVPTCIYVYTYNIYIYIYIYRVFLTLRAWTSTSVKNGVHPARLWSNRTIRLALRSLPRPRSRRWSPLVSMHVYAYTSMCTHAHDNFSGLLALTSHQRWHTLFLSVIKKIISALTRLQRLLSRAYCPWCVCPMWCMYECMDTRTLLLFQASRVHFYIVTMAYWVCAHVN